MLQEESRTIIIATMIERPSVRAHDLQAGSRRLCINNDRRAAEAWLIHGYGSESEIVKAIRSKWTECGRRTFAPCNGPGEVRELLDGIRRDTRGGLLDQQTVARTSNLDLRASGNRTGVENRYIDVALEGAEGETGDRLSLVGGNQMLERRQFDFAELLYDEIGTGAASFGVCGGK